MSEFDQKARYIAHRRAVNHMDPEGQARMEESMRSADDWTARCGYCGETLVGTIAQLQNHRCAEYVEASHGADGH